MCRTIKVVIPRKGSPRALYSEEAQALLAPLGDAEIRRAAHVEPTSSLSSAALQWLWRNRAIIRQTQDPAAWWADLTPVDGPVLGPFNHRETALKEELDWLNDHGIPFAEAVQEKDHREYDGKDLAVIAFNSTTRV